MSNVRRQGFTLIELLTVIAIIAILFGLTATVLPRMREKARITRIKSTFSQLNTAFTDYFAKQNSFPPGYGYRVRDANAYFLRPFTTFINVHGLDDLNDQFAQSYDTDNDGVLGPLEFLPMGTKDVASGQVSFSTERYEGNNLSGEVNAQLEADDRPLVYVPVNKRQFAAAKKYWIKSKDFLAQSWNTQSSTYSNLISDLVFPPQNYDAFVLISVGPGGTTGGVVAGPPMGVPAGSPDLYHIAALRTYFLATRDLNDNQQFDFEYEAREQKNEGAERAVVEGETVSNANLPGGKPLYGPLIYASK